MVDDDGKPGDKTQADDRGHTLMPPQAGVSTLKLESLATPVGSSNVLSPFADVAARYTLGAVIGEGGMGEVVLAFDQQIGREVAVKRIRAEKPSAEELAR